MFELRLWRQKIYVHGASTSLVLEQYSSVKKLVECLSIRSHQCMVDPGTLLPMPMHSHQCMVDPGTLLPMPPCTLHALLLNSRVVNRIPWRHCDCISFRDPESIIHHVVSPWAHVHVCQRSWLACVCVCEHINIYTSIQCIHVQ